jgi:predicted ATPase
MIRSILIKNFKSYKKAELYLSPLTLMIGANASGKSNVLEALRLLSWLAKGIRLDDIERNIQGADSLIRGQAIDLFQDGESSVTLGCRLISDDEDWTRLNLSIGLIDEHLVITEENVSDRNKNDLYRINQAPQSHTDEVRVMYDNFKRGGNKPNIPCSNRQAVFYQLETPARFDKTHEKSQRVIPSVTKRFRVALRDMVFLDPNPAVMREYSYAKDNEIKENGSNLSSVLYSIWNDTTSLNNKPLKDYLLDFVRSLPEQDISDINFIKTDRNDVMVRLTESFGDKSRKVDAPLLSDGTLRILAIAATLLTAPEGSLVNIEEIDNGVHPSRAKKLIQGVKQIAELRKLRVLLTSHNPALLNALPDESLGNVLCCYRDPDVGDSRIVQLKKLDRYPELIARGPLGHLMTQGVLDRFLKDTTTDEERKKNALAWLDNLKDEVSE